MSTTTTPRLLDTEALARHYGVATGSIHRWASQDHWISYGGRRTRQRDLEQAQASYDRRRADQVIGG